MLRERVLSAVLLGPPVLMMLIAGRWWMALLIILVTGIALLEFVKLVARRGHRASGGLMLCWLLLFVLNRQLSDVALLGPGVAFLLIITLAWTLARYRQGTANAITGFAMTLSGSLYIGWTAAHFVSLRALEDGLFWTLTVVLAVWIADSGAYLIGRWFGRAKLIQDISPGKTWEGYIGGVVVTVGILAVLPLGWQALGASASVSSLHSMLIGGMIAIFAPLGDFGISMIKRYASADDSSNLIPGHGGFLDRVDTLLIACLFGYYYLTLIVF